MAQFNETGEKAFTASGALGEYTRVKLSSSKLALAGVTDEEIGVIRAAAFASGDVRTVLLRTKQGTVPMVAAAAITQYATVYTAANGQVSSTNATGSLKIGVAMQAAANAGDIIEVLRVA